MDENHNNNTNTSPTRPPTNENKNKDSDGVKAPKRGRQSNKKSASAPLITDEEILASPPQKKSAVEVKEWRFAN
jgi:hypothetical protein